MGKTEEVSWGTMDGSTVRVGIIKTRWNSKIVDSLADGAKGAMLDLGVKEDNMFETVVPGSWELPSAARFLALSKTVDAIVCLGCLIKGDTNHYEYIAENVASGLMSVQLQTSVPCTFGVLCVLDEEQAAQRSYAPDGDNHGISWGKTAVEMALLRQEALGIKGVAGAGTMNLSGSAEPKPAEPKPSMPPKERVFF